ncbi:hypothetical protein [Geobacter benzoatilyticus]|uniref:PAS domain-containing protein n=1 Tax=Geobacter benzoatilyticus TaxID=2815309 RepID=A0ABX7Q385_9BACT|nr:hypothetical protein [Geobacter benzoatilyticus]QSV45490.1 hypothetical protein JZM60_15440 [Geobacter benzoatilyticus]
MNTFEINEEIRSNFHLFWDNYPGPVMLVHKDRTIIEANKTARELGCPVGTRCVDIGEKKHHAGCKANKALQEGTGVRDVSYVEHLDQVLDGYWIPLAESQELFVHFCNDITQYADEHLIPKRCNGAECGSCSGA